MPFTSINDHAVRRCVPKSGRYRTSFVGWLAGGLLACTGLASGAELQDAFFNRELVTGLSGTVAGSNVGATRENDEPRHAERRGGASVWISWLAPTNGIVTFRTTGSSFDTLVAAYYAEDDEPNNLDELKEAAGNDDEEGLTAGASLIIFGAQAGHHYEIAIDGYQGAQGAIELSWSLQEAPDPPPIILSTPGDQAFLEGQPLTLIVNLQNPSAYNLHWFLNDEELENEEDATLVLAALSRTNVGSYRLRLALGDLRFFTKPIEIQINSEGLTNSLVRDKLLDVVAGPGAGTLSVPGGTKFNPKLPAKGDQPRVLDAINRGYNGSQLYNTIKATAGPGEPLVCGQAGAVTWFAYQAPTNGTLFLDTTGSEIGVALSVFTYAGALTNLNQLTSITCASSGTPGTPSEIVLAVLTGQPYVVAIAGLNDLRGVVHLNYRLDDTLLPTAPIIALDGGEKLVAAGSPLQLAAAAAGSPPLIFSWLKDGVVVLEEQPGNFLSIPAASLADAGSYRVRVRNHIDEATSLPLQVRVLQPPRLQVAVSPAEMVVSFASVGGQLYRLEARVPELPDWTSASPWEPGTGGWMSFTNALLEADHRWWRIQVQ